MSFEDEFDKHQEESRSTSDFYKFTVGSHVLRIFTEPVKKASRYGHGICYPGAPYCDPAVIEKEYNDKMEIYGAEVEKARKAGATEKELKMIKKPMRANIGVKWTVWAFVRNSYDAKGHATPINEFKIVDLPNGVAEKLLNFKRDPDMGTAFKTFPMPYDVKIVVTRKKVANPTPKDIEYDIVASQKHVEVTESETEDLKKKIEIPQLLERMYAKQKERTEGEGGGGEESSGGVEYPTDDINPDDIPF